MSRVFWICILVFTGQLSSAQQNADDGFGQPVIWYRVGDPWAMFMGAEGPVIAVYTTGKVMYWKNKTYHLTDVGKSGVTDIISQLQLGDTFFSQSKYIEANGRTDQPVYTLVIREDTLKYFSVYGSMSSAQDRKNVPQQLLDVYAWVTHFDDDNGQAWLPGKIECMLSDYSYSRETPIIWPAGWPDLDSPDTKQRAGGVISIYLDKKYLDALKKMLRKRREHQAIQVSGKKFYIGYRLPLPGF